MKWTSEKALGELLKWKLFSAHAALPVRESYLLIFGLLGPLAPTPLLLHGQSPRFFKWITLFRSLGAELIKYILKQLPLFPFPRLRSAVPKEFRAGSHYQWVIFHLQTQRINFFLFLSFSLSLSLSLSLFGCSKLSQIVFLVFHFKEEICLFVWIPIVEARIQRFWALGLWHKVGVAEGFFSVTHTLKCLSVGLAIFGHGLH